MNPTGDYSRYHCFVHDVGFEERNDALKHLVKEHDDMTKEQAIALLDQIDEQYKNMDDYEEDMV